MKPTDLGQLLPRFFTEHLTRQRNLSGHTLAAYRDVFRLLLRFLQRLRRTTASELPLAALDSSAIAAFLSHLEEERHNAVRSRNARLAAIRSFVHYLSDLLGPALPEGTRRILSIPSKRYTRPMMGFLTRDEMAVLLRATDNSWTGRRNHLLVLLLYNTGARVSELTNIRLRDVISSDCRQVLLHGKGRKERVVPLWRQTRGSLRRWIKDNRLAPEDPLLSNRFKQALTRSGVAWQLRQVIKQAERQMPSLCGRRISPHTLRHTTAMHLLQSGVAHEVIALWLGHESPNTTHLYVEADIEMKRRTIEAISPIRSRRHPKQREDQLMQFLEARQLC
jgi:site-specific recombinase XerD